MGPSEHSKECLGSIKGRGFLEQLTGFLTSQEGLSFKKSLSWSDDTTNHLFIGSSDAISFFTRMTYHTKFGT